MADVDTVIARILRMHGDRENKKLPCSIITQGSCHAFAPSVAAFFGTSVEFAHTKYPTQVYPLNLSGHCLEAVGIF